MWELPLIIAALLIWFLPAIFVTVWAIKDRNEASYLNANTKWKMYGIMLIVMLIPIYNWFAFKELKDIK
jgi:hypothetical protein